MTKVTACFRLLPGVFLLGLAACDPTGSETPEPTRITVEVSLPAPSAFAFEAIPPAVASVTLDVRAPDCTSASVHSDTLDIADGQEAITFAFDLDGHATACFIVAAHSEPGGAGTRIFEGTAAGVDLTTGGHISVRVDLALVAATPPTVTTLAATDVDTTTATFNATVVPHGFETIGYFEWGLTDTYGSSTPVQLLGAGLEEVALTQLVHGLARAQTYHYRAVAINSGNIVVGADQQFTTPEAGVGVTVGFPVLPPPTVTTDPAIVTGTSAQLAATIVPEGTATSMHFEWGTDTSYGNTTAVQSLGAGTADTVALALLSGLQEGTQYHFRAVAYNAGGLTVGGDQTFLTSGCTPQGFEVPGNGLDDDCDSTTDEVDTCDSGLLLASEDPTHAALSMGICKTAADETDWGLVSARWVMPDGASPPTDSTQAANYHVGHGLLADFGTNVPVQEGARMLALGTGAARDRSDVGFRAPGGPTFSDEPKGFAKGYTAAFPEGFPVTPPSCPTQGTPHDAAALEVTLRVPPNATALSFRFKYHTVDYPNFVCDAYVDQFAAMITPFLGDATPGNMAFDAIGNPVSANSHGSVEVCDAAGGYPCPYGVTELQGTGFESGGASTWLTATAPVDPGSVVTLRFVIYDSQDGWLDSLVLLDAFQWQE